MEQMLDHIIELSFNALLVCRSETSASQARVTYNKSSQPVMLV